LANHGALRAPAIPSHSPVHPVSTLDRHLGAAGVASDLWSLSQSTNPWDVAVNTGKTALDSGSLLAQSAKPLLSTKLGAASNALSAVNDTRAALDPNNPGMMRTVSGAQAALDVASIVNPQAAAVNTAWGGGNAIGQSLNWLAGTVDKATGGDGSNTLSGMLDKGIDHIDPNHRFGSFLAKPTGEQFKETMQFGKEAITHPLTGLGTLINNPLMQTLNNGAGAPLPAALMSKVGNGMMGLNLVTDVVGAATSENNAGKVGHAGMAAWDAAAMVNPIARLTNMSFRGGGAIGNGLNYLSSSVDKATGGDGHRSLSGMLSDGIDHIDPQNHFGNFLMHIGF
jgi:hypothetical protein